MRRRYSCVLILAVLVECLQILGCGGGSGITPLVISATSLPQATVGQQYNWLLRVSGGTSPYSWAQTSGGAMPPGITFASTGNFIGIPTTAGTYGPYVFTVTDSSTTVQTASTPSISITVAASTLTVGTTSLPDGVLNNPYSATLTVTGGAPPYTWAETSGGNLPTGLSLTNGTISGTPTAAGTFGPYVFTVTDSGKNTAATGNLTITIAATVAGACLPAGNEAALTSASPYAFLVKGTDKTGNPIDIAGSFTPNGAGGITAAATDYNGFTNGPESLQVNLASSSYSFNNNGQGCLYLSFSGLVSGAVVNAAQTTKSSEIKHTVGGRALAVSKPEVAAVPVANVQFNFFMGSSSSVVSGRIIESDSSTSGTSASGSIHAQAPSAFTLSALQPYYAFGVDGWTASSNAVLRTAIAGTFANSSGNLSNGYADMDLNGTPTGEMTGGYGTLNSTINSSTGRGTGSYYLTTPTGRLTFDFAFYLLNGSDIYLISTDLVQGSSTTPLLAGRSLAANGGGTAPPAWNGNYLLASEGLQTLGTSIGNIAQIGTFNANSSGAIPTATIYSNYAGTYATNQYPNSAYSIEQASGRVTITDLTSFPPVVYLTAGVASDDQIVGFVVGTDPQSSNGVIVNQTASTPAYTTASVTGNYASSNEEDVDGLNGAFLGGFDFAGTGSYTVTSLVTGNVTNVPNLGSISVNSDGSGDLDGGNFPLVTNGKVIFAIPNSGDPLLFVFSQGTIP